MVVLYSNEESKLIEANIEDIKIAARRKELNTLEPTQKEFDNVMKVILDYIVKNRRIIYGGFAYNQLLIKKDPKDRIYDEENLHRADIEFYSPEPIDDLIKMCDILHEKKFKFVNAKDAQHHETYSLFVNFLNYCDVTYMPKILFHHIPIFKISNVCYAHPKFIFIDIFRQFNDPMTSYWRIDKAVKRGGLLFKHYPLETNGKLTKVNFEKNSKILDFIRKEIIQGSDLLVFGYYGYQYYMYKGNDDKKEELYVPFYDVISTNLEEDAEKILNKLRSFDNSIIHEEYHPFFQFTDNKISFIANGQVVLNVYGNNGMCIPCTYVEKKKIYVVTYTYMIQMFLILFMYNHVHNNKIESANYDYLLENIINVRNNYLKKHKKTLLDDTPFKEFILNCKGDTIGAQRKFRISMAEKIKKKISLQWRYDPSSDNNQTIKDYPYMNSSGKINNSKNKILN